MIADGELLRRYADQRSEAAFTELVSRYVDLVYSVALRFTNGDAQLAEDVTQSVFLDLSRKASFLQKREALAGWLHTSARFAAGQASRTRMRRKAREEKAASLMSAAETENAELNWQALQPVVDEALGELTAGDQEILLLRFFQSRTLREIGEIFSLSENAARMRIDRALEKLRRRLERKGVTSSASFISAALLAHATTSAPATLAGAVIGAVFQAGALTSTATLISQLTIMSKSKALVGAVLLAAAVSVPIVLQQQKIRGLAEENARLHTQIDQLQAEPGTSGPERRPAVNALTADERSELLRLRGTVGLLRQDLAAANQARAEARPPALDPLPGPEAIEHPPAHFPWELGSYLAADDWVDAGLRTPEDAIQTLYWARRWGETNRLAELWLKTPQVSDENLALPQIARIASEDGTTRTNEIQMRMAGPAVRSRPPDYSQLRGGRVALIREISPREIRINVDEDWPDGRKVQAVHRFRLDGEEWKFAPDLISRPFPN